MGIDIENEINKKRWERWREKQNKEREKTYCYWGNWNNWNNWSDVTACECDGKTQINPVKETDDYNYKEYRYTIRPQYMTVKDGETWNIYLTAHLYTRHEDPKEWIEIGAHMRIDFSKPKVFSWVSVLPEGEQYDDHGDWTLKTIKEFKLIVDPDTGDYWVYQRVSGEWKTWRSGTGMLKKLCLADMAEEYFSDTYWYTESNRDRVEAAKLVTGTGVNKDFDDVPNHPWKSPEWWSSLKYNDIPDGLECWIECD